MQTERVTFLTSRDHKAALDAYAKDTGMSVGHVVREATSQFISQPPAANDEEAELAALVAQVNEAIPKMEAAFDDMSRMLRETHEHVNRTLSQMSTGA